VFAALKILSETPPFSITFPASTNNGTATRRKLFIEVYINLEIIVKGRS
jgi:hypothetical protein